MILWLSDRSGVQQANSAYISSLSEASTKATAAVYNMIAWDIITSVMFLKLRSYRYKKNPY